ncbi:MAG: ATP-binding cassette domain-containing protein [Erysipelotrichaceae bacterium]|nr:ATP-binding cassette domain-containing protein [Erysipelotrichaceae bacterium]
MKIEVKNLSKSFKENQILDNVSITFSEGKIYGLAGRNGSGKSVFLKIITGLYAKDAGTILYNSKEINFQKEFPHGVGALIEKPNFFNNLSGYENLKLLANIQNKISNDEILKSLEIVNLTEEKDKKYAKYSLGMKQKLGIAQAIMEQPEVIILDEPFNGIEEFSVKKIKEYLKSLKKQGKTIILSSHIKEDLQELCDFIYLFDDKKVKEITHETENI